MRFESHPPLYLKNLIQNSSEVQHCFLFRDASPPLSETNPPLRVEDHPPHFQTHLRSAPRIWRPPGSESHPLLSKVLR
jgi:hypothetical protein